MKNIDTDKIIGAGLIAALLLKIIGDVVIVLFGFTVPAGDLATNIVACLAGYMGRSLLEKIRHGGIYYEPERNQNQPERIQNPKRESPDRRDVRTNYYYTETITVPERKPEK